MTGRTLAVLLAMAGPALAQEPRTFDEIPVEGDPVWMVTLPEPTPTPAPEAPEGMHVSMLAGGLVSLSSETTGKLSPLARIAVDGPIALPNINPRHLPRVFVVADLTALPGDTIDLSNIETFKSIQLSLGVSQRVAEIRSGEQRILTSLYAEAGFASRINGDIAPRDRAPRFGSIGVALEERTSGSFLRFGLAADQRLDGRYQPAAVIGGAVKLWDADTGSLKGARAMLSGTFILGLDLSYVTGRAPARRDMIVVGLTVGGGK
jgi:hypothetical protein